MRSIAFFMSTALLVSGAALSQSIPAAVFTDQAPDAAHPASMTVLHIPTHGLLINGVLYAPSGAGPHPTLVICHGLPGNEKNLDLAQAVRRAGWNAVTFNYRGSWGSPGQFRFVQNIEDARAVLAYLRDPANALRLRIDTRRIVIAGHSMGGWVTANVAANDSALLGAILISAADMSAESQLPRERLIAIMADNMEALAGVTAETMADDLITNARGYNFANLTDGLAKMPVLVLSSNDGLAPATDVVVKSLQAKGDKNVSAIHADTDHGWSDHRIFLEARVIEWLGTLHSQ